MNDKTQSQLDVSNFKIDKTNSNSDYSSKMKSFSLIQIDNEFNSWDSDDSMSIFTHVDFNYSLEVDTTLYLSLQLKYAGLKDSELVLYPGTFILPSHWNFTDSIDIESKLEEHISEITIFTDQHKLVISDSIEIQNIFNARTENNNIEENIIINVIGDGILPHRLESQNSVITLQDLHISFIMPK